MGVISNLTKKYENKPIFDNYSLHFPPCGLHFVLGNSGTGKTTLLRIISGLDREYVGDVSDFGKISMMFQEYRLLPWLNAIDNATVALPHNSGKKAFEDAKELLMALGFSEKDLLLKPSALSGGMKQRISFVRAIIADSDTVLLDEPFKELDSGVVNSMYDIILHHCSKKLFIIVTHDDIPDEILSTSRVLRIGNDADNIGQRALLGGIQPVTAAVIPVKIRAPGIEHTVIHVV